MFSNPISVSSLFEEATVVQVDGIRYVCKVKTLKGRTLHSVQWLTPVGGATRAGDRFTPTVGERVLVSLGLGYPIIIGFLPRLQTSDGATPLQINDGVQTLDMGNYSPEGTLTWGDHNKPKDLINGDRLLSTVGGAILALLRSGSVIIRASRGSEVFLSKIKDLVRIVSRNWEHFTDVSTDIVRNYQGRVYRYVGYATTFAKSKIENYRLNFFYGNVQTAELIKSNYNDSTPAAPGPEISQVIYKEQITTDTAPAVEVMRRTLSLNGNEEVWINNGGSFTRVSSSGPELRFSWNDQNTVIINGDKIHAYHKDGADVILDANGIRSTFKDGSVNMSAGSVVSNFDGNTATLDTGKVELVAGAGKCTVTDGQSVLRNAGHAVTVTSSGVQIT